MGGKCVPIRCGTTTRHKFGNLVGRFVGRRPSNSCAVAGYYTITKLNNGKGQSKDFTCCVNRPIVRGSPGSMNSFVLTTVRCRGVGR